MIIFNIYAIVVALLTALFASPVLLLYYFNVIDKDITNILVGWILLAVSIGAKQSNVNARLFFIPMWILSIPVPFMLTYVAYGWIGILVTLGIFVSIIGIVYLLLYNAERKKVQQIEYATIDIPNKADDNVEYWNKVKEAFFIPTFVKFTPSICHYNLNVIEKLSSQNTELQTLDEFKKEMIAGKNSNDTTVKINSTTVNNLLAEIDNIIIYYNKTEVQKA